MNNKDIITDDYEAWAAKAYGRWIASEYAKEAELREHSS